MILNIEPTSRQPTQAQDTLNQIEMLSRKHGLFYVFEVWEMYHMNGWCLPVQAIINRLGWADTEQLEQGDKLFWTVLEDRHYPFFPPMVLAALNALDAKGNEEMLKNIIRELTSELTEADKRPLPFQ